ncbi:MAG: ABC transporter ATP-binding protein [Chloroflexi bacterium]|nr:ABC transporter ATP-binding protein [Chloroflexota bacterium]
MPERNHTLNDSVDLLVTYLRPQWRRVALLGALVFSGIALQLANPQVIRAFIDTALAGGSPAALTTAALAFFVIALAQRGVTLAADVLAEDVGWAATNALRADLTEHCLRLDMTFHKQHTPGELIERIDGDVSTLAGFFSQFTIRVLGNGLLVLGVLILLFREDARLGAGLALVAAATFAVLGLLQSRAVARWIASRQTRARLNGFLEEWISGAEDIRAIGAEPYVIRRLLRLMRDVLEAVRGAVVFGVAIHGLTDLVFAFGYVAGLALGVYLFQAGTITLGTTYLIIHYISLMAVPLQHIRREAEDFQQAAAGIQRVNELLQMLATIPEEREIGVRGHGDARPSERRLQPNRAAHAPAVEFCNVSFHYEGNGNVLHDVSFALPAGKVLGVLGRTGSGKTTLTRLLFRLYDPSEGRIGLNGRDLRDYPVPELRAQVGMVTQDVQLFRAAIRDNLTFFNPQIDDAQIERALKELRLWEWLQTLPDGLSTPLLAGGQGLSAGEAQLLAFTRVWLKEPGLVILDEASSRLDPATETLLERAVDRLFERRTGIVIAHHLRTVQRADDILILDEGRVAEYGPRTALAADPASRFYRLLQTGMEEVLA